MDAFDPTDPAIVALMDQRGHRQAAALRLASGHVVNFDPQRMLEAAATADPTSILGDDDSARRLAPAFSYELTPQQIAAAQAYRDVIDDIVNELKRWMEAASDVIGAFAEQLRNLGTEGETKRHGHASLCPKHGFTKGGLCRVCTR